MSKISNLKCRVCGGIVCSNYDAEKLVSKIYELSESSIIKVWHPGCAVSDRRINNIGELSGDPYYYELCN